MTLRLAAPPGGGRRCGRDGRARLRAAQLRAPRRDRKGEGARQRGRRLQRPRRHSACVDAAPHRLLGLSQAAGEARRAVPRHYGGGVDKEIVEQILLQAKKDGKTNTIIAARDKIDGKTPVELAKERQAELLALAAASGGADGEEKGELDEKRKYDQIVQMLEKGGSSGTKPFKVVVQFLLYRDTVARGDGMATSRRRG
eukprot:scaffold205071_cov26-Tisochrysis_lutea.AAC.1